MHAHYNVLFLCTGNSARSILAEAILNFKGRPHFTAFRAAVGDLGMFAYAVGPSALRGGEFHYGRLLVHFVDLVF